jgi:hypothetical protein
MSPNDDFFIGYEKVPERLGSQLTGIASALGLLAVGSAAVLAVGHARLQGGAFAFGDPRPLSGIVATTPYPAIQLDTDDTGRAALLVAQGKHGLSLAAASGQRIRLDGARIARGDAVMLEVVPDSVMKLDGGNSSNAESAAATEVTVTGEIVDSKCFLGVMVPGDGTTHRDCASLCIRGGIPPALLVRDRAGRSVLVLLTSDAPDRLRGRAVSLAGSAVEVSGRLTRRGGWFVLESDPAAWRSLEP